MKFGIEFTPQRTAQRRLLKILAIAAALAGAACFLLGEIMADSDRRFRVLALGGIVLMAAAQVIRPKGVIGQPRKARNP
jgi:hypothetical protein